MPAASPSASANPDDHDDNARSEANRIFMAESDGEPDATRRTRPGRHKIDERSALGSALDDAEAPGEKDVIESWVGLDFGGDEPNPEPLDVPDYAPELPEDADAARAAFRRLLDFEETAGLDDEAGGIPPELAGGNGHHDNTLNARVYDYADAGMTAHEIARELGVGKGEVRLILSLRKSREI